MTSNTKTDLQRRKFLKTAGLSVGAAAVAGTVLSPISTEAKTASKNETGAGYHETEHIKTYYDLARS
jgi:nitrous oxide reductase